MICSKGPATLLTGSVKLLKFFFYIPYFCYNPTFLEPVGAKAPTFSNDLKSFTFSRKFGQSFALLCQAQAWPVPVIR